VARLKDLFYKKIIFSLKDKLFCNNIMAVPRIVKITLNMGIGSFARDKKKMKFACKDLTYISGQKSFLTFSKNSIAGFKIRSGWPVGIKVTLRNYKMYEFLDRLITIVIPRIRDFRGLSLKSFDGSGNFNMGIKEQIVFPEIDYDSVDCIRGLDIAITTTAKNNDHGKALLLAFNFPLKI
jgi:large subunit ribosomal protein L5